MKIFNISNSNLIFKHILAWLIYGIYTYVGNKFTNHNLQVIEILFYLLPFILIFYSSLFSLWQYKRRGLFTTILTIAFFFAMISLLCYSYVYIVLPKFGVNVYNYKTPEFFLRSLFFGFLTYFTFALLYYTINESLNKQKKIQKLQEEKFKLEQEKLQKDLENSFIKQNELETQKEKLQLEYAFLRTQINPHFLYNTLNVLYSQAMDFSQDLAENILKLSNMMRYSLETVEFKSGKVSLKKEVQYLQTLIEINNLRFADSKNIIYQVIGDIDEQYVPPLSLITIVENAFKYGDLKDSKNPLIIKLKIESDLIYFYCKNKKGRNNIELSSHNIGITNLKKRLDISFEGKYDMKTIDENDFYTFELVIKNDK